MNIRVDCYLKMLKQYKLNYPKAHFEVITRTAQSILAPSEALINEAKKTKMNFEDYQVKLLQEYKALGEVFWEKIRKLREISKVKIVFLVCFEKDPLKCHRTIVKKIIEGWPLV